MILFFGLVRPYKGVDVLLEAFRSVQGAELWIVGRPRMPLAPELLEPRERAHVIGTWVTDSRYGPQVKVTEGVFTYVAVGPDGRPRPVPSE